MNKPSIRALFVSLFVCATGCLASSQRATVVDADAQRIAVSFETPEAQTVFVAAVNDRYRRGDGELDRTSWGIPLLYASNDTTMLSENAFFNRQVARADLDRNRVISELEAREYDRAR